MLFRLAAAVFMLAASVAFAQERNIKVSAAEAQVPAVRVTFTADGGCLGQAEITTLTTEYRPESQPRRFRNLTCAAVARDGQRAAVLDLGFADGGSPDR